MTTDPAIVTELDELLAAIRGYDDPRRAAAEWKRVYRALQKTLLPSARVAPVVGMRDVARLAELIERLRAPDAATLAPQDSRPGPEVCKRAFRAFRKRLTLTRLDDESTLGHGPLTRGAGSSSAAIIPPSEWPDSVWQELVRQGKLRSAGHGLYELAKR